MPTRTALAIALATFCALGPAVATGDLARPPSLGGPPATPTVSAAPAEPFATRAGYSPTYASEVVDARPTTSPVKVDVTFSSSLSSAAYASLVAYFGRAGLYPTSLDAGRLGVDLEGTARAVGSAFGTELVSAELDGRSVQYPGSPPHLPADLESEVSAVVGLSSGFTTFSFDLSPAVAPSAAPGAVPVESQTMTPALARQFYGFTNLFALNGGSNYPTNSSIAVILWGDGYDPNDLSTFFSSYYPSNFPAPSYRAYPLDGAPAPGPGATSSNDTRAVEELTLDIEWAESMAPGATVDAIYVPAGPPPQYSPSTADLTDAIEKAIALNVSVISMSFGTAESSDAALKAAWSGLFQEAEQDNITVLAATGDSGGDTSDSPSCSGTAAPQYPSSSPAVIAVGGTNVSIHYNTLGQVTNLTEAGWASSGGGFSTQFAAPSWQNRSISPSGYRAMPDVSASAADDMLYYDGSNGTAGGTSFATPLWAGLVADLDSTWGHRLGYVTPSLYHVGANEPTGKIGAGLEDVTGGSNCIGPAGPGWDVVTGWGSPRATQLYYDLLGSFVTIHLSLDRSAVAPGGPVVATAQVTNRTSGAPIAGVPVDLSATADTDLGPCTGTFDNASPVTNATGWVSVRLTVPFCYLGQHAFVNASVSTTKLYGTAGTRVAVNLLGFFPSLAGLSQPPWVYVTFAAIVGAAALVGAWLGRPREAPGPPSPGRTQPSPGPGAGTGPGSPSSVGGPVAPPPSPGPGDTGAPPDWPPPPTGAPSTGPAPPAPAAPEPPTTEPSSPTTTGTPPTGPGPSGPAPDAPT